MSDSAARRRARPRSVSSSSSYSSSSSSSSSPSPPRSRTRAAPPLPPTSTERQAMSSRHLYIGGVGPDVQPRDIDEAFSKYGEVRSVELKLGYAFVRMGTSEAAAHAIRALDRQPLGRSRKCVRVEVARGDGQVKRREDARLPAAQSAENETLFVTNFDPMRTTAEDLRRHFEGQGPLLRVSILKSFAFVQYEDVRDAAAAKRELEGSRLGERSITVEFATNGAWRGAPGAATAPPPVAMAQSSYRRSRSRSRSASRSRSPVRERTPIRSRRSRSRSRSPDVVERRRR